MSVYRPNYIEIFGRSVTIVEDDSGDSCWHCALNDICQSLAQHLDTFTKWPCRKADGTSAQYFAR